MARGVRMHVVVVDASGASEERVVEIEREAADLLHGGELDGEDGARSPATTRRARPEPAPPFSCDEDGAGKAVPSRSEHAICTRGASRCPRVGGVEMSADDFEELVQEEFDDLPDAVVDGLDNVVFVVEDRPEDGEDALLGLYDGLAITERGDYGYGELPDRITIYRLPLLEICDDDEELRDEVHITLVHEIAHYYGIDDDELTALGWG